MIQSMSAMDLWIPVGLRGTCQNLWGLVPFKRKGVTLDPGLDRVWHVVWRVGMLLRDEVAGEHVFA